MILAPRPAPPIKSLSKFSGSSAPTISEMLEPTPVAEPVAADEFESALILEEVELSPLEAGDAEELNDAFVELIEE